ncbi:Peptide chain release factor 1 [Rhodovastum atsumiense]|uniref:Peptide chain release factor 1 n=1 Tax=Rhodovastum atsumiense TaxID=504468 RepID=A0A5M6IRS8_9PROT|nr:peptide chain release factor 1 [Rhodovastum atsumiense]KAA5610974.1 peptide chain release factor 1 [Rhodovastum atsumiense]CAH2600248.1 Peptide chain release factor 1 [Rhodovastum atsumiense]
MTEADYARKLTELDQLLNDPDVPMQAARVWSLLAELSEQQTTATVAPTPE